MRLIFIKDDDGYLRVYPGSLTDNQIQKFIDPFTEGNYAGDAYLSHCRYITSLEDCKDIESKLQVQVEDINKLLRIHPQENYLHLRFKYTGYYISEVQKYAIELENRDKFSA
jgi:hypothetical protein